MRRVSCNASADSPHGAEEADSGQEASHTVAGDALVLRKASHNSLQDARWQSAATSTTDQMKMLISPDNQSRRRQQKCRMPTLKEKFLMEFESQCDLE